MSNEATNGMTNGAGKTTEPDWIIVRDSGLWLIGRLHVSDHGEQLSPVFELSVQIHPHVDPKTGRPGGVLIQDHVQPLMLMSSMTKAWALSTPIRSWALKGASREKQIRDAIARAEELVRSMRAQEAGLVVAREMPRGRIQ